MTNETTAVTSPTNPNPVVPPIVPTGEATGFIPVRHGKLITVIANDAIRATLDEKTIQQAINSRKSPGVTDVVLNPDAHLGYGAPIGCVMASPTHIYPGPVGVDIKCSMSLLQFDIPEDVVRDKSVRRALINAIVERTPTGAGHRKARKGRHVDATLGSKIVTQGASSEVLNELGIPLHWASRCEDSHHTGHNGSADALRDRLARTTSKPRDYEVFASKMTQLGTYGGGNHFGECEVVRVKAEQQARADAFGLKNNHVAFLSHCGSRGWGALLADRQFKTLQAKFEEWNIPLPGGDRHLVYAPLGSEEANNYIDDMSMGANFATVNHLLINTLIWEAFNEVLPGAKADLVYFISHNIARQELLDGRMTWVHRKGATRAFPAGHPGLKGSPFESIGHPILLPGNPQDGSSVMVAEQGASISCYSVNHGAGRTMSRNAATRTLNQQAVDQSFHDKDILTNCRNYPIDEAPRAYKDFNQVLKSVESAGLASEVARLDARFVIKDGDKADD